MHITIAHTWDGQPLPAAQHVRITLTQQIHSHGSRLHIDCVAPYYGDPAPPGGAASTPGLWNFEVVELFFLGADQHYTEIELSPHGHYLVLQLHRPRHVVRQGLAIDFTARRAPPHWQGHAELPWSYLPQGLSHLNAYAIAGQPPNRRYLAAHPVKGTAPDFHQLQYFAPIDATAW